MDLSKEELQTISNALHQLLAMHISAMYDVEDIVDKIDESLKKYDDDDDDDM